MSSSSVSRLLKNRLGSTLAAVLVGGGFAGPAAGAPDGRISPSRAPAWGTTDSSVLTLIASDFGSLDDSAWTWTTQTTGGVGAANVRGCLESGAIYLGCMLQAGVPLPSGALIEYMELAACDNDTDSGATASLHVRGGFGGTPPPVATVATQGDPGCLFWTSGFIGVTVDNLSNDYSVTVELPAASVWFRAVRIFYRLQVSPAPAFASFNDVPTSHPFFQYVEALYASGITAGCGGGNFCPNGTVTRGQMAVFLAKALGLHFPN